MGRIRTLDEWMSSRAVQPDLLNGLSRLQRTFVLEKIMGANDKNAALAAGYSLSVAENTKEKVWKPRVRAEFQRLTEVFVLEVHQALLEKLEAQGRNATAPASAPATPC